MTPLAQRLFRQELDGRRSTFPVNDLLPLSELATVRCFDCTEVSDMANALADDMYERGVITEQVAFLPAPLTWIEYFSKGSKRRMAFLLQALEDTTAEAAVYWGALCLAKDSPRLDLRPDLLNRVNMCMMGLLGLREYAAPIGLCLPKNVDAPDPNAGHIQMIYALLAIINTPRLIAQTDHAPHAGLQRQIRRSNELAKTELLKWTTVRLCVLGQRDSEHGHSDTLTGHRALHFCRSFIRIRLGKLELVKAHMRGNAAYGERRPDYVVRA